MENKENSKELEIQKTPLKLIKTDDISPIVQLAMRGEFKIEQLDKLIDVQEKFEKIQAEKEFNIAFSKFKQKAPVISKDSKVEFKNKDGTITSYNHASLANIMTVVTPLLSEQGLAVYWVPSQENGQVTITAVLTHILGHSVKAPMSAPPDSSGGKNSIQAVKSTTTYLERTTTLALLGLAESTDNDGRGDESQGLNFITPDQVENLQFEIDKTSRDNKELTGVICNAYKVPSLQHIQSKDYAEICDKISKTKG